MSKYSIQDIIGNSNAVKNLRSQIFTAAAVNATVLITGETGTGKELVAHAIHSLSQRKNNPFIRINCSAIPDELIESELFGYEEGAFTGASLGGKEGAFELANNGAILLDEIADLPKTMQAKLLRVLQEKEIIRIGGKDIIPLDVRIIAACNINLKELIKQKQFRQDLYYRLNVINITVPSLRERLDDIPLLVDYFIKKNNLNMGMKIESCSPKLIKLFKNYDWPGNIRELQNIIERAMIGSRKSTVIDEKHINTMELLSSSKKSQFPSYNGAFNKTLMKNTVEETEKELIIKTLRCVDWNKTEAAKHLGIARPVLYKKMKRLGIALNEPE